MRYLSPLRPALLVQMKDTHTPTHTYENTHILKTRCEDCRLFQFYSIGWIDEDPGAIALPPKYSCLGGIMIAIAVAGASRLRKQIA